jgi:hypothetical protein
VLLVYERVAVGALEAVGAASGAEEQQQFWLLLDQPAETVRADHLDASLVSLLFLERRDGCDKQKKT